MRSGFHGDAIGNKQPVYGDRKICNQPTICASKYRYRKAPAIASHTFLPSTLAIHKLWPVTAIVTVPLVVGVGVVRIFIWCNGKLSAYSLMLAQTSMCDARFFSFPWESDRLGRAIAIL